MNTVLVVVAHPDDEVLGCGGVIAKHIVQGDSVHILFMTDGVASRNESKNNAVERLAAAQDAAQILGINSFVNADFPDNKMDSIPLLDVVKEIEDQITQLQPEIIYTHHIGDLNIDHQVTHKAVMTACRPQPDFCVKEIYAFEVLSSTEWNTPGVEVFSPNVFIDITDYIDIKKQALEVYSKEMRQPPHSRSIDNVLRLNTFRGNSVGMKYAEAFMILRVIR